MDLKEKLLNGAVTYENSVFEDPNDLYMFREQIAESAVLTMRQHSIKRKKIVNLILKNNEFTEEQKAEISSHINTFDAYFKYTAPLLEPIYLRLEDIQVINPHASQRLREVMSECFMFQAKTTRFLNSGVWKEIPEEKELGMVVQDIMSEKSDIFSSKISSVKFLRGLSDLLAELQHLIDTLKDAFYGDDGVLSKRYPSE